MDKNIAAILREDARTVLVRYTSGKTYGQKGEDANEPVTYVTTIDLEPGDHVVVPVRNHLSVAEVVEVHDDLRIQPNEDTLYKWVVQKVDLAPYYQLLKENDELGTVVGAAYQRNLRASFAQSVLSSLADEQRAQIAGLLGSK